MSKEGYQNMLKDFRSVQQKITNSLNKLNNLNDNYLTQQEKKFTNTFLQIMDRMSNQLTQVEQQCLHIDKEIQKDYRCSALQKQLDFLQNQTIYMSEQLKKTQQLMKKARSRNQYLKTKKKFLTQTIANNTKKRSISSLIINQRNKSVTPQQLSKSIDTLNEKNYHQRIHHLSVKNPERNSQCSMYMRTTAPKKQSRNTMKQDGVKKQSTRDSFRTSQMQMNTIKYLKNTSKKFRQKLSLFQLLN